MTAPLTGSPLRVSVWGENVHEQLEPACMPSGYRAATSRVPHPIVLDEQEMYGEFFDIPAPDELVFVSSFTGGEVFRSGCTFRRGFGRILYFSPGDQAYPVCHHPDLRRVTANGVHWARTDRPERTPPTVLRYDSGDVVTGHGYTGPRDAGR